MRNFIIVVVIVLAHAASAAADIDTSPGKNSAFRSLSGVSATSQTTVSIAKAKPKRVLKIDFTISSEVLNLANTFTDVRVWAEVNGVSAETGTHTHTCNDSSTGIDGFCTVSGMYFVDLDAAEEANPGTIKKQQLDVELRWNYPGTIGSPTVDVVLATQLIKK